MRKSFTSKAALVLSILVAGFVAKAELPALTVSEPSSLPATVTYEDHNKYIDVDGDGQIDLGFYFSGYNNSGSIQGIIGIYMYNSGQVYAEYEGSNYTAPVQGNVPLTDYPGNSGWYTSFLPQGTLIPSGIPSGIVPNNQGMVSNNFDIMPASPSVPLNASSYDGLTGGYVGVYFSGASGHMYGWLNVTIHGGGTSATINSVGAGSGPGAPVAAGLGDPFAVPFPLVASILGFALVGSGIWFRKRRK